MSGHYILVRKTIRKGKKMRFQICVHKRRSGNQNKRWGLPGGHTDKGESHIQAARRECREEACGGKKIPVGAEKILNSHWIVGLVNDPKFVPRTDKKHAKEVHYNKKHYPRGYVWIGLERAIHAAKFAKPPTWIDKSLFTSWDANALRWNRDKIRKFVWQAAGKKKIAGPKKKNGGKKAGKKWKWPKKKNGGKKGWKKIKMT